MLPELYLFYVVVIIFLLVGNRPYKFVRERFILNNETPQAVIDFPVDEFNEEEVNAVKAKIERFITDAFENPRCELSLTAKQLNYACNPRVKRKGFFFKHYEFENDKLIEKELIYPDTSRSEGYEIKTWTIRFAGSMTSSEYSSLNGTKWHTTWR